MSPRNNNSPSLATFSLAKKKINHVCKHFQLTKRNEKQICLGDVQVNVILGFIKAFTNNNNNPLVKLNTCLTGFGDKD